VNRQGRQDRQEEIAMREPSRRVDDLARQVIGAAIEVHRVLGPGFLETVYEEALAIEFNLRNIPFERQRPIVLMYKGKPVGDSRLDFLVGQELVVELKAIEIVHPIHPAKVINYLKITGLDLGLIINFHVEQLKDGVRRIVVT